MFTMRYLSCLVLLGAVVISTAIPYNILRDPGVTCQASSAQPGRGCDQAMDGRTEARRDYVGRWISQNEGAGAWILFQFEGDYDISEVRVMQKFSKYSQFKDVDLEFSDGSKQSFTLTERTGENYYDETGRWWDELNIQPVKSSYLRIRAISYYSKNNNGFEEVEVIGEPAVPHNILSDPGVTCRASSEKPRRGCDQAMDGNTEGGMGNAGRWVSDHEGAGAWILFQFERDYDISEVRVMQKFNKHAQFKDIDLEFSDGSKQRFTLSKRTGEDYDDKKGRWWDELDIQPVKSSYLRILAISHYSNDSNGLEEVEVIGERVSTVLPHNILSDPGVTCQASSAKPKRGCDQAMDGRTEARMGYVGRWISENEGAGAWIMFQFESAYDISKVRVMQKFSQLGQFKEVDLEFSGGSKQRFTLSKRTGKNYYDESGRWWDELDIQPVTSTYLRIRAISHYSKNSNGFEEVEVIGSQAPI